MKAGRRKRGTVLSLEIVRARRSLPSVGTRRTYDPLGHRANRADDSDPSWTFSSSFPELEERAMFQTGKRARNINFSVNIPPRTPKCASNHGHRTPPPRMNSIGNMLRPQTIIDRAHDAGVSDGDVHTQRQRGSQVTADGSRYWTQARVSLHCQLATCHDGNSSSLLTHEKTPSLVSTLGANFVHPCFIPPRGRI